MSGLRRVCQLKAMASYASICHLLGKGGSACHIPSKYCSMKARKVGMTIIVMF